MQTKVSVREHTQMPEYLALIRGLVLLLRAATATIPTILVVPLNMNHLTLSIRKLLYMNHAHTAMLSVS